MASDHNLLDLEPDEETKKFKENFPYPLLNQGISAELIAERYNISRAEMDKFSAESHERFAAASKAGYFRSQILPIRRPDGTLCEEDECYRVPVDMNKVTFSFSFSFSFFFFFFFFWSIQPYTNKLKRTSQ